MTFILSQKFNNERNGERKENKENPNSVFWGVKIDIQYHFIPQKRKQKEKRTRHKRKNEKQPGFIIYCHGKIHEFFGSYSNWELCLVLVVKN